MPKNDFAFNKTSITSNNESYSNYYDIDNSYSFFVDDLNLLKITTRILLNHIWLNYKINISKSFILLI